MNYREHLTLNTAILVPTAYVVADRESPIEAVALFLLGYIIGTFWLSPDLDCHSQPYKNWWILKTIWKPYQLLPHRSVFSHGPIVGSLGRIIYVHVAVILALCGILLFFQWSGVMQFQGSLETVLERYVSTIKNNPKEVIVMLIGLELSSISHLLGDIIGSIRTKLKARGRRRGQHQICTGNREVSGISV